MSTAGTAVGGQVRHDAVTAVVCLALAAVTAAMSSLNVALPDIARATQASQTQLAWIVDAYSLAFAVLLLPGGALGDRYGRRRMLLLGLAVFGAGSVAAMCVSSAGALIGLRAVIGVGAALIMPATLSTITGTFPPAQRVKAVSIWAAVAGAAAVVGVLLSGALLEVFHWEAVFATNVVLAAVAIVGTLRVVPESADSAAPRLDLGGAGLSVLGLVAVVYSVIQAPTEGWISSRTLIGITVGVLVLAAFVLFELHQQHPMLNPRIFSQRRLSAGSLSIFIQFFAFYGFMFLMLQYLQIVRHDSALVAAVSVLPMALGMIPSARLAPKTSRPFRVSRRLHHRTGVHRRRAAAPGYRPRQHRLLGHRRRTPRPGHRHGSRDDPGDHLHHRLATGLGTRRRLRYERPVPGSRWRAGHRRPGQRHDRRLPQPPDLAGNAHRARRSGQVLACIRRPHRWCRR